MQIGYARVSTRDQNLALQIDALKAAGCERIFDDKASGASRSRPGLDDALSHIRRGDTLVVWKLDRLGRTAKQLIELLDHFRAEGIEFKSLTEGFDTSTTGGKLIYRVMAAVAEMERDLIRERTRAGLDSARAQGLVGGRKKALTDKKLASAKTLLQSGTPPRQVAEQLGVSVATLYRHIPAAASIAGQA